MFTKIAAIALSAALLAACAPVPRQAPSPPPQPEAAVPAPAPAPQPAEMADPEPAPLTPVDVRHMTCATLTSASDDDKAYASSFLVGYRTALRHSHSLDVKEIETAQDAALADCAAKPDAIASKVFAAAMLKATAGAEPPRRPRRKVPPAQLAPTEATPDQSPSMQYTPAQTAPPQPAPAEPSPTEAPPGEGTAKQ